MILNPHIPVCSVLLSVFPQFTQHLNVVSNLSFDGKGLQLSMQFFFSLLLDFFSCFFGVFFFGYE